MILKAIVHPAEAGGFWAEVPALPGCLTQGETLDELQSYLREAIELWLSVDDDVTTTIPHISANPAPARPIFPPTFPNYFSKFRFPETKILKIKVLYGVFCDF